MTAFTALVARYQSAVCAVALSATGDSSLSEDIAQETFLTAWRRAGQVQDAQRVGAWLCAIARNKALNAIRKTNKEVLGHTDDAATVANTAPPPPTEDHTAELWNALKQVPEIFRETLVLFYQEDQSVREVARGLGLAEATVRQRLSRGRRFLRERAARLMPEIAQHRPGATFTASVVALLAAREGVADAATDAAEPVDDTSGLHVGSGTSKVAIAAALTISGAAVGLAVLLWGGVNDDEEQSTTAPMALRSPSTSSPATPRKPAATGVFSGRVVAKQSGAPIAGAYIAVNEARLLAEDGHDTPITTDDRGAWTATHVPAGEHSISASAPGYLPTVVRRERLRPGNTVGDLVIQLEGGGVTVTGTVRDISEGPIAGARIAAVDMARSLRHRHSVAYGTVSDSAGRYQLTLPLGQFELSAVHGSYVASSRSITVENGVRPADFLLVPSSVIEGVVRSQLDGTPIANAEVSVASASPARNPLGSVSALPRATTDLRGQFRVTGVPPGAVELSAYADGFSSREPLTIDITVGEQASDIELWVPPAYGVSGVVTGEHDNTPMPDAEVALFNLGSRLLRQARTDEAGRFELVGVPPGTHSIHAVAQTTHAPATFATTVTVKRADITNVAVTLPQGYAIRGSLSSASSARISLEPATGLTASRNLIDGLSQVAASFLARIDVSTTGDFTISNVPPGRYNVIAQDRRSRRGGIAQVHVGNADVDNVVIDLESMMRVCGHVVETDGTPAAGLSVTATLKDRFSLSTPTAITKHNGEYELDFVHRRGPKLGVTLKLFDSAGTPLMVDSISSTQPESAACDVNMVTRISAPRAHLEGLVVDENGDPVADAWVIAHHRRGKVTATSRPSLTNSSGQFIIRGLQPVPHTVTAASPQLGVRGVQTQIEPGTATRIVLRPPASLLVTVTQGGVPVTDYTLTLLAQSPHSRVVSSDTGRVAWKRIPLGTHLVVAETTAGIAWAEVTIGAARQETLALALTPWASASGRAVDANGNPVAHVTIFAVPGSHKKLEDWVTFRTLRHGASPTMTDSHGYFELGTIPPGKFGLAVLQATTTIETNGALEAASGEHIDLGTIHVELTDAG